MVNCYLQVIQLQLLAALVGLRLPASALELVNLVLGGELEHAVHTGLDNLVLEINQGLDQLLQSAIKSESVSTEQKVFCCCISITQKFPIFCPTICGMQYLKARPTFFTTMSFYQYKHGFNCI